MVASPERECPVAESRTAMASTDARPASVSNKTLAEKIDEYVRPATFPVAVKFLHTGEEPPPKTRTLLAGMQRVTVCQGWAIARRYGWTTVLRAEDMKCRKFRSCLPCSRKSA